MTERANRLRHYLTHNPLEGRPLAAPGLTSYRCRGGLGGWIMIGATGHEDAMREARRSSSAAQRATLEVWDGAQYVPA